MQTVLSDGQLSWHLYNNTVDAYVTQRGAHLGPVRYQLPNGVFQPYHVAPWAEEDDLDPETPEVLKVLRGDWFCLPFGLSDEPGRESGHPLHGQPANETWRFVSEEIEGARTTLVLAMDTSIRPGHVERRISIVENEPVVYQEAIVTGMSGPMTFGTHPTLAFPSRAGSGLIALSPYDFGQVFPGEFEDPETGGVTSLQPGAHFSNLNSIPRKDGSIADVSRYPAEYGFENMLMVMANPKAETGWSAVTFPNEGYVWFSLRDPQVLTGTAIWMSNGGRPYAPWNSRNKHCLGLEDITSYWGFGVSVSSGFNPYNQKGYRTHVDMQPDKPLVVRTIQGLHPVTKQHGRVRSIDQELEGVRITFETGQVERVKLDSTFVWPTK